MDPLLLWPVGLSLLLLYGAVSDIRERRLANWLSLALLVFGLAHGFILGGASMAGWHVAHAAIALVVGMVLFAAGVFGGGDAKFYAGMAAFFPLAAGLDLVLWVAILGGIIVIGWMILRRLLRREKPTKKDDFAKFPYGVAIAAGGIVVAWQNAMAA